MRLKIVGDAARVVRMSEMELGAVGTVVDVDGGGGDVGDVVLSVFDGKAFLDSEGDKVAAIVLSDQCRTYYWHDGKSDPLVQLLSPGTTLVVEE